MFNYADDNWDNLPDENKWNLIRLYRNDLLQRSDWTQIPDAPLTEVQKAAWAVYRQNLRDLPSTYSNPDTLVFPSLPTL